MDGSAELCDAGSTMSAAEATIMTAVEPSIAAMRRRGMDTTLSLTCWHDWEDEK